MNAKKLLRRLLIAMLLAVAVYGVFVLLRGYRAIGEQLATFEWSMFAAALGLTFGNYVLRFVKWEIFLHRLGVSNVPKVDSFLTYLSGFVLTVTPGKVGEVFKSVVLYETHHVPLSRTAPIVIAERLTDVVGIAVLVAIGSTAFPGGVIWAGAGGLAVTVLLVLIASRAAAELGFGLIAKGPAKIAHLVPRFREAWESLRELCTPSALWLPTLLSIGSWALEGVSLWLILRGFHVDPGLQLALFAYSTSTLAGALIPVPGGLGITEGSLEQQLTHLGGLPVAVATSGMLLIRVATLWFAVLLGFISLGLMRLKFPHLLSGETPEPRAEGPAESARV